MEDTQGQTFLKKGAEDLEQTLKSIDALLNEKSDLLEQEISKKAELPSSRSVLAWEESKNRQFLLYFPTSFITFQHKIVISLINMNKYM